VSPAEKERDHRRKVLESLRSYCISKLERWPCEDEWAVVAITCRRALDGDGAAESLALEWQGILVGGGWICVNGVHISAPGLCK